MTDGIPSTATEIVKSAADTAAEMDAKNRLITVRRLDALQYYRLLKVMGATSANDSAMDMAALACAVRKIDAQDIAVPATEREVEFLIQQLGFEGIAAAGAALKKLTDADTRAASEQVQKN